MSANAVAMIGALIDSHRQLIPDEVQGLIAVSGVEMIPDPGKPGAELRELLGPRLRE
jgi:hypothetical protein